MFIQQGLPGDYGVTGGFRWDMLGCIGLGILGSSLYSILIQTNREALSRGHSLNKTTAFLWEQRVLGPAILGFEEFLGDWQNLPHGKWGLLYDTMVFVHGAEMKIEMVQLPFLLAPESTKFSLF